MADIQLARYGRRLQSQFGLRQLHTLTSLVGDVLPVVDVDRPLPENQVFQGVDLAMGRANVTGAAGENPTVSLAAHPNRIVTVEGIWLTVSVSQSVFLAFQESLAGAAGYSAFRDFRRVQQGVPAGRVVAASNPAPPTATAFFQQFVPAGTPLYLPLELVLTQRPGTVVPTLLTAIGGTVATTLYASFSWRERYPQPDELVAQI